MPVYQGYSPTNTHQLIMSVIFYAMLIIFSFFSLSAIYVLVRDGRSRPLAIFVSVIYMIFYLSLAAQGILLLGKIQ